MLTKIRVIVEPSEVDPSFHPVGECVERADDVVAVEPEIEREVIARARRHAHVCHVVLHRNRRDQGLGAVPACHADDVCTT